MEKSGTLKGIRVVGALRQTENLKRYAGSDKDEILGRLGVKHKKRQKVILFCASYYFSRDYKRIEAFLDWISRSKDLFCIVKLHPATPLPAVSALVQAYKENARIIQFFNYYDLLRISDIVVTHLRSTTSVDAFICSKNVIIWQFRDEAEDNEHFIEIWDPKNPPYIEVFSQEQCEKTIRFILKNSDVRDYLLECCEEVKRKLGVDGLAANRVVSFIEDIIGDGTSPFEPPHAV
jgi:hypothetical protein